jgi:NitT/TauT family transport system permease protein
MKRIWSRLGPPIIALVVTHLVWEIAHRCNWISPLVLPAPSEIAESLWKDRQEYSAAFLSTAEAVGVGLFLSTTIGFALAVLFASSSWMLRAFAPFAVFFQTVPIIAIAPLLVIWFGYGLPSVIASSFIVSLFPMIASSLAGLQSVDPSLRDIFRLYGAGRLAFLFKLVIPSAFPQIFTGLKIVAGLAVIGAIVGEFLGGVGLGSIVDVARTQQRLDKVFAAVFLASLLGLVSVGLVQGLRWLVLYRWHFGPTTQNK